MATDQGELFPDAQDTRHAPAAASGTGSDLAPVWLQRASLVVLVVFCFYIGGLLVWMPWTTRGWWTENGWLMAHPGVNAIAQQGWFRGLVSGLGLLDIGIGISEMVHYRDFRN